MMKGEGVCLCLCSPHDLKMKSGYLGVFGLLAGTLKNALSQIGKSCVTFKGKTEMWL